MEELNNKQATPAVEDTEVPLDKNVRLMSPTRMVVRRFFRSKLSILGLVMVITPNPPIWMSKAMTICPSNEKV